MSADFLFTMIRVPGRESDTDSTKIHARLASISDARLVEAAEWSLGWGGLDDANEVLSAAQAALEYINSEASDFGFWEDGPDRFVLTGGMSWGDEPTEAFRHIRLLEELGITDDTLWV